MVGKRAWEPLSRSYTANGSPTAMRPWSSGAATADSEDDHADRDAVNRKTQSAKPRLFRFRDVASSMIEDARREELKKQLIEGIVAERWEKYRKSQDEIKAIKNKKVREFYRGQNERLNNWLEVDTLVEAMAGGIFDSFDPDRDHDGIAERTGALQGLNEDIEALLPDDERVARRRGERNARLAINVGGSPNNLADPC
jgi:hypothetical protein